MEKTILPIQIKFPLLETISKRGDHSHLKNFKKVLALFDEEIINDIHMILIGETFIDSPNWDDQKFGQQTYLFYYKDKPSLEHIVELFIEKHLKKEDLYNYLLKNNSDSYKGKELLTSDYWNDQSNWFSEKQIDSLYEKVLLEKQNNYLLKPSAPKIF